jgi:hypothetical protein
VTPLDSIRRVDDLFFEILHDFNLFDFVSPVNVQTERDRFFESVAARREYNPVFEYAPLPPDLLERRRRLEALDFGTTAIDVSLARVRDSWVRELDVAEARGTPTVTGASVRLFGEPSAQLVAEARRSLRALTGLSREPGTEIGVLALAERFRERLREDQVEGWDVATDPQNVGLAVVDPVQRRIRLEAGLIASPALVARLLHHEIGVHVYRRANGERQPVKLFALGWDGHRQTEEGIALVLEERMGLASPDVRRRYAGRVVAASLAPRKNFFDIYRTLVDSFPPEEAFTLTLRTKRGLQNTAEPGGFISDHMYLQGKKDVEGLSQDDFEVLYTGRIAVHHLPVVRELLRERVILEPAFFPDTFHG